MRTCHWCQYAIYRRSNLIVSFTYTNRYCIFFRVAPTVDAVLLSHLDMMHLGALPYAMKHLGLSAPVYATEPVFRLGLLTMYDHFLSRWVSFMVLNIFLGRTLFNHTHFQYRRSRGRWRRRVRMAPPTRRSCCFCLRPEAVVFL